MYAWTSVARALAALSLLSLAACGGGDVAPTSTQVNTSSITPTADTSSPAATDAVVVEVGGTADTAAGSYAITGGAGGSETFDTLTVDVNSVETDALNLAVGVAQQDAGKYLVAVTEASSGLYYICLGGTWTADEIKPFQSSGSLSAPPACPAGVTIDLSQNLVQLNKVALLAAQDKTKTLIVSTSIKWTSAGGSSSSSSSGSAVSAGTVVVASSVSSSLLGLHTVSDGTSATASYGSLSLQVETQRTDALSIALAYSLGNANKFVLAVRDNDSDQTYACTSSAWQAGELQPFLASFSSTLPVCPAGIVVDVLQGTLRLDNVKLLGAAMAVVGNSAEDTTAAIASAATQNLVLSANLDWSINTAGE